MLAMKRSQPAAISNDVSMVALEGALGLGTHMGSERGNRLPNVVLGIHSFDSHDRNDAERRWDASMANESRGVLTQSLR